MGNGSEMASIVRSKIMNFEMSHIEEDLRLRSTTLFELAWS